VRLFDPAGEAYDRLDHDASRIAIEEALSTNAADIVIADCSAPFAVAHGYRRSPSLGSVLEEL
jgi:hypothetical protein